MSHIIKTGDLAIVVPSIEKPGKEPNLVRSSPNVGAPIKGRIPEQAVLAILPKPIDWEKSYPYDDGKHLWFYVRGRSDERQKDNRFKPVEGWTAASEMGREFILRMEASHACLNTMGTAFDTYLARDQDAYVLANGGLNIREEIDLNIKPLSLLEPGSIVTILSGPECKTHMVWWQVISRIPDGLIGWVSEGDGLERFLVPWTP